MTQSIGRALSVPGVAKSVSRLVLGTAFDRRADKEHWFALLDRYRELGGKTVDSAHSYGESEEVVGEWLASRKAAEDMLIVTKCAHGEAILPAEGFAQTVDKEITQSFRDLGIDVIDLLFLHRDNPAVPVEPIMEKLTEAVRSERVRAVGASNWTYERIDAANAWASRNGGVPFSVVSNNISLPRPTQPFYPNLVSLDRAGEAWHETKGFPLIPWSSQARGFFTGRWPPGRREGAVSRDDPFAARMLEVYGTEANYERYRRAQLLGSDKGNYTAMQVGLSWVLARPFPIAPVVRPHSLEELDSCVEALSLELTEQECSWLDLVESGP